MASTTHWRQFIVRGEKLMRKLSYVFMVLSPLCFAAPAFAQGGASSPVNWVAIAAGFSMAIASAICGLAQGRASGRSGGFGTQSRGPLRYSIRADSWFGADRITGAVHP